MLQNYYFPLTTMHFVKVFLLICLQNEESFAAD